jgi:hypothetical protein
VSGIRAKGIVSIGAIILAGVACETSVYTSLVDGDPSSQLPAPDGIDPRNPHIERSTTLLDFDGVRTIRVDIPTGHVTVSQSDGSSGASLRVTEIIVAEGLGHEVLAALLTSSSVTAERSFVDESRLDIEATLAEGLAHEDIAFDVRLVIPNGANVEIFLENGPVEVLEVSGNVEIRTANGAVVVDHVEGNVVARTSNRSIRVVDVVGDVQAETSDADISLRLSPPEDGMVSAETTDGDINLSIAQTTAASLSLIAEEGVVSANLSGFEVSNITTSSGLLQGVLNGGGGRIEAHTTDGEITFSGI